MRQTVKSKLRCLPNQDFSVPLHP
uniref:Uncharacterized protein n=1 Tax=Anguilla anguilla TaxID=7936 RepID=A0A0E9TNJ6_ANGAN